MTYGERVCGCGCGRRFWPRRLDQKYASPLCRAGAWRRAHPQEPSERFAAPHRTDACLDRGEPFSGQRGAES